MIITLDALQRKRVQITLQEELRWLRVVVPEPRLYKVNAYIGCSNWGKRTDVPLGMAYGCSTYSKKDFVSSPRSVVWNSQVACNVFITNSNMLNIGSPSTVRFPIVLGHCRSQHSLRTQEKLFRMTAPDIFSMKHSDDQEAFKGIQELLHTSHVLIEVGPKTTLSRNNVLQWILKQVVFEDEPDDAQIEDETPRELGNDAFAEPKECRYC